MSKYFSEILKQLRKEFRLTQQELAEKLGVQKQTISNWESNRNIPEDKFIPQLANIFNVDTKKLFEYKNDLYNVNNTNSHNQTSGDISISHSFTGDADMIMANASKEVQIIQGEKAKEYLVIIKNLLKAQESNIEFLKDQIVKKDKVIEKLLEKMT